MDAPEVLEIGREAIWVSIQIGAPVMGVALVVGLAISLVQALTQIQEMTLTFVPKILVIFLSLLIFLPNLIWQIQHNFISLEFVSSIHARECLRQIPAR